MPSTSTRCDACGLPPLPNKQLLECTRCKQAHYHDRQCQIDHYPKHKAACRRDAAAAAAAAAKKTNAKSTATSSDAPTQTPLVKCRSIDGKGRSLFATSPLDIGCHPLPTKDGLCEPIAHPVLLESMRTSRCAYCFQSILHNNNNSLRLLSRTSSSSSKSTTLFHYHCSTKCQSLDTNWKIETHAAQKVPSPPSPTALSCSRILRKLNNESTTTPTTTTTSSSSSSSSSSSKEFNELCYNVDLLSEGEKEAYKSIMTQCHLFLRAMGDIPAATIAYNLLHHPGDDNLTPAYYQFMSRLSMNGFTISTSEQVPIGHGIYCGVASMMNHSCRPNAVPTFWLKPSTVPMLQISVCKKVEVGEEVTIGYCDVSSPRSIRRDGLWNNYKFKCDCSLCRELDRDDKVVGLKCTSTGCKGMVRSAKVQSENESSSSTTHEREIASPKYACNSCGSTNFDKALEVQAQALSKMKRLESEMNNNNQTFDKKTGEEAKNIYHQLKQHCTLQTSYYVAWSADLFVHWCANALGSCTNEQDQLHMCHEALVVVNESRSAANFCMQHPGNLSWQIKRGIEAKLRLFVNPMDMEAHRMLRDARKELLVYYPSSDVTMKSLEESLAAYSFS